MKEKVVVAIAGCGGIGSNVARFLVQSGFYNLFLADFDRVEESNLNRQFFSAKQIGKPKAKTLKSNLMALIPSCKKKNAVISFINKKIDQTNAAEIFSNYKIVVEAFDKKECKQLLVNSLFSSNSEINLVCANGIAGDDCSEVVTKNVAKNLFVVGDFKNDVEQHSLYGYKVSLVASLMAQKVLELVKKYDK